MIICNEKWISAAVAAAIKKNWKENTIIIHLKCIICDLYSSNISFKHQQTLYKQVKIKNEAKKKCFKELTVFVLFIFDLKKQKKKLFLFSVCSKEQTYNQQQLDRMWQNI